MIENISSRLNVHMKTYPQQAVNFREIFESELFGLSLKEVSSSFFGYGVIFFTFFIPFQQLQMAKL